MTENTTENDTVETTDSIEPVETTTVEETTTPASEEIDQQPAEGSETAQEDAERVEQAPGDSRLAKVRREAQNLRGRLTTAETERDLARSQLDQHRRTAVEELAARAGLAEGGDLWRDDQVQLDDLIGEDGNVDPDSVTDTVRGVLDRHPHWRRLQRFNPGNRQLQMRDQLDQQPDETDDAYEVRRHREVLKIVNHEVKDPKFAEGWAAALRG